MHRLTCHMEPRNSGKQPFSLMALLGRPEPPYIKERLYHLVSKCTPSTMLIVKAHNNSPMEVRTWTWDIIFEKGSAYLFYSVSIYILKAFIVMFLLCQNMQTFIFFLELLIFIFTLNISIPFYLSLVQFFPSLFSVLTMENAESVN